MKATIKLPQVQRLLLTRAQYDTLVTDQRSWMDQHWLSLDQQWSVGGVSVTGSIERISDIERMLGLKVR